MSIRNRKYLWFCFMLMLDTSAVRAHEAPEIPFKVNRLSDRVLFIKSGISTTMSNVTALTGTAGIVLIDAHYKPEWGRRIRTIVEEAFACEDFSYLVYSHAGVDHMGGSPAFNDAVIIGHDNCAEQIDSLHQTLQDIDIQEGMAPRLKLIRDQIHAQRDDPSEVTNLKEALLYWSELADLLSIGFRYSKPAISFNDRLTLEMGDLTLELRYCTPGYSQSDILVYVPQEKLLVTGDIFVKHRIPLLNEKTDVDRWRDVFTPFVEEERQVKHIIGCHGGLMSLNDLRTQLDYLSDLWEAVNGAKREGLSMEQAKERLSFKKRYPHLNHLITRWAGYPIDLHERNIEQAWKASDK
jgi:cyclase